MDKAVLLAPPPVARVAAAGARRPEESWLLRQPRAVRASYAQSVIGADDEERAQEIWMLRQPKPVRESYIREVLLAR